MASIKEYWDRLLKRDEKATVRGEISWGEVVTRSRPVGLQPLGYFVVMRFTLAVQRLH